MKKFLAMLMAIAMVITLLPAYGLAESTDLVSVGSPVQRTQLVSYAVTQQDGAPVLVGVSSGTPAKLMVVDLETQTLINDYDIECGNTFYAYTKDSVGNVYFAGYSKPVKLYKYSVTDKAVTELCSTHYEGGIFGIGEYEAQAICDMTVDENDNIYLGTYPASHILKYSNGTLSDLGSIYKKTLSSINNGDEYAKSLCYYNGKLYVGGNKEGTFLVEYNLSSKATTKYELELPEGVTLKSMYSANVVGDRMFVFCHTVSSGYYLAVFDLTNKVWTMTMASYPGSYAISAGDNQYAYIINGVKLQKYNLANDTYEAAGFTGDIGGIRTKDAAVIDGVNHIAYVASGKSYISIVNPETGKINKYDDALPKYADMLESFMLDSQGNIYASPYQGGLATKYDPYEKEVLVELTGIGQASAIKEIDGKVYFGTYPQADLCVYDPTLPVSSTNPKQLYAMPEENQGRPMDIVKAGNKLVMSTIGGYGDANGKSTGCIVVYDTSTGHYTKYKGGDMEDYQMVGLYYDDATDTLYVTTSVVGGHNSTPVYEDAKIFYMYLYAEDAITETSTQELYPDLDVVVDISSFGKSSGSIAMCGGLEKDPSEDKLWCVCNNGIFSVDMNTLEISDCISIGEGPSSYSRWQPYGIEFTSAGELYATPGDKLVKVDTSNNTYTQIAADVFDMALQEGEAGTTIYTMAQKADTIYVMNQQEKPEEAEIPELVDGWYQITSFEDFMYIKENPTASYKLMNDITVGTADAPFTAPFEFSGVLDGNGKTINAYIKGTGIPTGLFSKQTDAAKGIEIKNLTLTGRIERTDTGTNTDPAVASVGGFLGYNVNYGKLHIENCVNKAEIVGNAAKSAGGFVGYTFGFTEASPNDATVIINSKNYGSVSADYQGGADVGGFMGLGSGTVKNCVNLGTISGKNEYIGGIVGKQMKSLDITESVNMGTISTAYSFGAGGLVGIVWDNGAVIKNSYNAGEVTNTYTSNLAGAGGLVGRALAQTTTATIEDSYNSGKITCGYPSRGNQITGYFCEAFTATDVYYAEGTDTVITSAKAFGDKNTLADIGFSSDVWTWDTSRLDYPYLTSIGVISDGSAARPFEIATTEDFLAIKNNPTACYKLINDITVGTEAVPFTAPFEFGGVFDGNGKTITVNIEGSGSVGLFKSQSTAGGKVTIKNLTLKGSVKKTDGAASDFSAGSDCSVGAFIGYTANHTTVTIENCANYATVDGGTKGFQVGGIVGRIYGNAFSVIKNTNNYANVSSDFESAWVGGIAGVCSGTITECANAGSVTRPLTGSGYAGGLVSDMRKGGKIEKSANFGRVSAIWAGGLIGRVYELDTSNGITDFTVENSFNTGAISGAATNGGAAGIVGGRINAGSAVSTLVLTNVYNSGVITGNRPRIFVSVGGDGNTTVSNVWFDVNYSGSGFNADGNAQMHVFSASQTNVSDLGFSSDIWTWDTTKFAYPYITKVGVMACGTATAPYEIKTFDDFLAIKNAPSAHYKLMNDITVGTADAPFTAPFEFSGVLDGNGNTINAYIKGTGIPTGLFSKQTDAAKGIEIKNLTLTGRIERTDTATNTDPAVASVGGFLGYNVNYGKLHIENCVNKAEIVGNAAKSAGGFVGYTFGFTEASPNDATVIINSKNYGSVSADYQGGADVGGFMGLGSGTVKNCVNLGTISGKNEYIGGIVGKHMKTLDIAESVNVGTISTAYSFGAGGLVGIVWDSGAVIKNSYNAGEVTNTYTSNLAGAGGLVGRALAQTTTATIEDSYNSGKITCGYPSRGNQITGYFCEAFTATDVYYAEGTDTVITSAKAFGDKNTLADIGFSSEVWTWDTTAPYPWPTLKNSGKEFGTDKLPYIIETKEDFLAIKDNPTASYYVANDIDLGSYEPFTFKGHLTGKVKADGTYPIINVAIEKPATIGVGLFANIDGYVRIENLELTGSVLGGGATGGFAGFAGDVVYSGSDSLTAGSYIKNCINKATITSVNDQGSTGDYAGRETGGIVGMYRNGAGRNLSFTNLVNKGDIISVSHAGGIVGNVKGIISNCVNEGRVEADNCVGGIAGFAYDNRPISNSYNTGDLYADSAAGGIVGRWQHPGIDGNGANSGDDIVNCYNIGNISVSDVTSSGSFGSIVGNVEGNGGVIISGAYNAGSINGSWIAKPWGTHKTEGVVCTLNNVFELTVDGDSDADAITLGIAGLETTALGAGFATSTNSYPFPQIASNLNTKALELVMLDKLTVAEENGTVTAGADVATNLTGKDMMFVLAVYDSEGRLVSADMDKNPINKAKTSFDCTNIVADGNTYKLMIMDSSLAPYIDAIVPVAEEPVE